MTITRHDIEYLLADCNARRDRALAYVCKRALGDDPEAFDVVAGLISRRRHERACALELAELAGCRQLRYNIQTGTRVGVYNAAQAQLDDTGGAWAVVCENHGTVLNCQALGEARRDAARPLDWCSACRADLQPR